MDPLVYRQALEEAADLKRDRLEWERREHSSSGDTDSASHDEAGAFPIYFLVAVLLITIFSLGVAYGEQYWTQAEIASPILVGVIALLAGAFRIAGEKIELK